LTKTIPQDVDGPCAKNARQLIRTIYFTVSVVPDTAYRIDFICLFSVLLIFK